MIHSTNISLLYPKSLISYSINGKPAEIEYTKNGFVLKIKYQTIDYDY